MPKVLTDVQKQNREVVSKDLEEGIEEDPHFLTTSLLGMKVGSITTARQNVRATNGTLSDRLDRRKLACPSRE
ncbi:hypothetical protein TNCV_3715271 [Trichonephila clavipes]|nr:hypothetical protein TNCV_3715271 [Trichonephila clavipes]